MGLSLSAAYFLECGSLAAAFLGASRPVALDTTTVTSRQALAKFSTTPVKGQNTSTNDRRTYSKFPLTGLNSSDILPFGPSCGLPFLVLSRWTYWISIL